MRQLSFGLIGGGPWALRVHGPVLAAHPRARLAGVWTRRPEAAAEVAARFGARAHTESPFIWLAYRVKRASEVVLECSQVVG